MKLMAATALLGIVILAPALVSAQKLTAEQKTKLESDKRAVLNFCGGPNYPAPPPAGFDCKIAMREKAAEGNMVCQYLTGVLELSKNDVSGAVSWLEKAANQGYPTAMIELGRIYSAKGPTFEADNAIFWYYKAAATEDAEGLAALAKVYLAGELMVQNYKEAVRLLEESARVG